MSEDGVKSQNDKVVPTSAVRARAAQAHVRYLRWHGPGGTRVGIAVHSCQLSVSGNRMEPSEILAPKLKSRADVPNLLRHLLRPVGSNLLILSILPFWPCLVE
ncbi:hypothetical protein SLA2020_422040 [Shorea laevis]